MEQGDKVIHYIVSKYVNLFPVPPGLSEEISRSSYELFCKVQISDDEICTNLIGHHLPLCITQGLENDIIIHLSRCTEK